MEKRQLTAEDLFQFKFVGDPEVSPDGKLVAYVLTQMDLEKDGYFSFIYVTDMEGNSRKFTYHYHEEKLIRDISPQWSPDGTQLAFLSNRTGKMQVWVLPIAGGEAAPLTDVEQGVSSYIWSPDGKRLALSIKIKEELRLNSDKKDVDEKEKSDVKQITRLRYKFDGAGIVDDKRHHIFLFDTATKEYTQITSGDFDFHQPSFSPDGQTIYYIGSRDEKQEWEYIPSIWSYQLETKTEKLVFQAKGAAYYPKASPDGKWIAFVGNDKHPVNGGNLEMWIVSTETGEAKSISSGLDRTVGNLVGVDAKYDTGEQKAYSWLSDSSAIYFTATVGGDVQLFKVSVDGEVSSALSPAQATITSFDTIRGNDQEVVMVLATPHSSGDIVHFDIVSGTETKLTDWNKELVDQLALSTPEVIHYTGPDGWEIEGWVLKPYGFEVGKKYPLILQIHGGPHTAFGNGFHHEFQLMAAKGYVVLYTNPRGSHGYGEKFVTACIGDWAGKDYEDIMAGVDHVLSTYDFIDKEQLFVTGGSYGGFMTNMIITRTERFKAAVTERCISNMYSFFGTSDIGFFFGERQLGQVDLWEDEEKIMQFSPIRYARNVKTPTLIIHSEEDLRCPMEQAEQWYIALRRLGVETKLIRFPKENHDLSRTGLPKHRLERLGHLLGWFEDRTEA